jgi:regulator of sigma E protease
MLVVSAGVIMNIILAAIGFMVLFLMGFNAPPAVAGSIMPNSPAAKAYRMDASNQIQPAPIQPGDRILYFDDKYQHDFTKITLNVALAEEGSPAPMYVERVDGTREHIKILPERADAGNPHSFLMLGISQAYELRGVKQRTYDDLLEQSGGIELAPAGAFALKPGETITHVNGEAVGVKEYHKLEQAVQASDGKPVTLRVIAADGATRELQLRTYFATPFGSDPLNFAGMLPRPAVEQVLPHSSARGKLQPGDVIVSIAFPNGDLKKTPSGDELLELLNKAGQAEQTLTFVVERDGKEVTVEGLSPNIKVDRRNNRYGLGIQLGWDSQVPVVAGVIEGTPAAAAEMPDGARITQINDKPVQSWADVKNALAAASPGEPVQLTAATEAGEKQFALKLTENQINFVAGLRYGHPLLLHELVEPRQTDNAWTAMQWGIVETRDFVLQFYLTLQRMVQGSVSYKNMMGPVGIFDAGRKFAYKGNDWLIWFLAMISANLAVVNFLPIPIVDGGLFVFLIIEKIQGRPLSAKTQSVAQVVGLAMILSIFLLVTYQDIARFL